MRLTSFLLTLLIAATPALAQDAAVPGADTPLIGSQDTATTEDAKSILVIGDSLAGGLAAGMVRMAEGDPGLEIEQRFNEESGVARPEVYDWAASLAKIVEGRNFDAIAVLIGSNDRQEIRADSFRYPFGTPQWADAYNERLDRILAALKASGAAIYWVSLPPMGDVYYDTDTKTIADLQKARVEEAGGTFIDVRAAFLDKDGRYTDSGPDETGTVRKLRASDGVNFFKQGNNRFGQLVLAAIASGKPAQVVATPDAPAVPSFVQAGTGGEEMAIEPDLTVAAVVSARAPAPVVQSPVPSKRLDPMPGSAADKLFTLGESQAAPKGRIDDYTFAPPTE